MIGYLVLAATVAAATALGTLAVAGSAPGGPERATIGEELRAADVDRITVTSIDYTRLVTTDQLKVAERGPAGSLWDTLIGALLSGKHLTLDPRQVAADVRRVRVEAVRRFLPWAARSRSTSLGSGARKRNSPFVRSRSSSARSRRGCVSRCSPPRSGPSTPRSSPRSAWPAW